MTAVTTCDHCADEPGRTIVDRRSRATMVRQLRTANRLADTLQELLVASPVAIALHGPDGTLGLGLKLGCTPQVFTRVLSALIQYQAIKPRDEDLLVDRAGDDDGEAPA